MSSLKTFLRRHRWWLLPEFLAVVAVAAGLVYLRGDGLPEQLAAKARVTLEELQPARLELYDLQGHSHGGGYIGKVICTAETFGMEPAEAERVEDVKVIYARYLCALVQRGTPWDYASRSSGPVVIKLTDPPYVQIPPSGDGYPDRVRALFPDTLEPQAFAGFRDKGKTVDLLKRYHETVS